MIGTQMNKIRKAHLVVSPFPQHCKSALTISQLFQHFTIVSLNSVESGFKQHTKTNLFKKQKRFPSRII